MMSEYLSKSLLPSIGLPLSGELRLGELDLLFGRVKHPRCCKTDF